MTLSSVVCTISLPTLTKLWTAFDTARTGLPKSGMACPASPSSWMITRRDTCNYKKEFFISLSTGVWAKRWMDTNFGHHPDVRSYHLTRAPSSKSNSHSIRISLKIEFCSYTYLKMANFRTLLQHDEICQDSVKKLVSTHLLIQSLWSLHRGVRQCIGTRLSTLEIAKILRN